MWTAFTIVGGHADTREETAMMRFDSICTGRTIAPSTAGSVGVLTGLNG